ncbi:MAG: indole-3-glycerol phosphate synthase TrpC [Candidatus Omnitrophota bacterium]|nr:indole-3-glycerol phosphate synthase TrpC [Candidatus Omnitrophota bacterium]MDZ4242946.1 indole-3-glycerol phosphate synthase TrpC [Candidatus Omnitrophota bacterium]
MDNDFLKKIVEHKQEVNRQKDAYYQSLAKKIKGEKLSRYHIFQRQISQPGQVNLIAEIKKASPSMGLIREEFDVLSIARAYVKNGAAAISVLTEEKYFLGKPRYVAAVSENFPVPVLTKDFILHEGQIHEAFVCGASAVLLIMAILKDEDCRRLLEAAGDIDMDCLLEVHNEAELDRALNAGAQVIGVNNRDLRTFAVDMKICETLIPKIPKGKTIVAESGIRTHADIMALQGMGVNAVLIGETFMRAPDIGQKVREVMSGK